MPVVVGALKHFEIIYSNHVIKLSVIKAIATTMGKLFNVKNGIIVPNKPKTKRRKFKAISTEYCECAAVLYVRACKRPLTAKMMNQML